MDALSYLSSRLHAPMDVQTIGSGSLSGYVAGIPNGNWVDRFVANHGETVTASGGFLFRGRTDTTESPAPSLIAAYAAMFGPGSLPKCIAYTELWYVEGDGLDRLFEIASAMGFPEACGDTTQTKVQFEQSAKHLLGRVWAEQKLRLTVLSPFILSAKFAKSAPPIVVKAFVSEAVALSSQFFPAQMDPKRWIRELTRSKTLTLGPM